MSKYGPGPGELKFRIAVSIFGLALMIAAVWHSGMPEGPALVEVVGLGSVFFGGTLFFSIRRLLQLSRDKGDPEA
jgi:hypothetical protein